MKTEKDKMNFDDWYSDLVSWLANNNMSFNKNNQGINDEFNNYVNEYLDNHFGKSEFLDSYFSANKNYRTAVISTDKTKKDKLLKQALSCALESQKIDDPHSGWYGINSLIDAIKEALDELENSSNSTSTNQDS